MCGMQTGDEGKGTFSDWIAHNSNAQCIVKYNGGCQASHTVELPDGTIHKFAQLGSGMFKENMHTLLTKDFIINLGNLLREAKEFAYKNGEDIEYVLRRIHIHKDCMIVTPYHKLMNHLRELNDDNNKRGSVGTGVSEVPQFLKQEMFYGDMFISIEMVFYEQIIALTGMLQKMQWYVEEFYNKNKNNIVKNCPKQLWPKIEKEISDLLEEKSFYKVATWIDNNIRKDKYGRLLKNCMFSYYEDTLRSFDEVIWEGSQGFLLDKDYGIAPNTTMLKTTNEPALDLAYLKDDITKIGLMAPFTSRHGPGAIPTESDELNIMDKNQQGSYWNGSPRYGWFDVVMFQYSQSVNDVDEIFLSQLDRLSGLDKVKICMCYEYKGVKDDDFNKLFETNEMNGRTFILSIKQNDKKMKSYLKQCIPLYKEYNGWENMDGVFDSNTLFARCGEFLEELYNLTNKTIKVISIGPTRNDKIIIPDNFVYKKIPTN